TEVRGKQVPNRESLDPALAVRRPNPGAPQEAMRIALTTTLAVAVATRVRGGHPLSPRGPDLCQTVGHGCTAYDGDCGFEIVHEHSAPGRHGTLAGLLLFQFRHGTASQMRIML